MSTYTGQLSGLINWIMLHVTKYLTLETCEVSLVPFKLTDDDNLRSMLMQMFLNEKGISPTKLYEAMGMDYAEDLQQTKEDAISKAIADVESKFAVDRAVFLASKEIVDRLDKDNDYRTALAKAQQYAQQLYQADPTQQIMALNMLETTDFTMFLMVSRLLQEYQENPAVISQQEQDAEGGPPGAGGSSGPGDKKPAAKKEEKKGSDGPSSKPTSPKGSE